MRQKLQFFLNKFLQLVHLNYFEFIFLSLFLFGALSFAIITPLGNNPDEPAHVLRTWQVSQFNLRSESNDTDEVGGYLPVEIDEFFTITKSNKAADVKYKYTNIDKKESNKIHTTDKTKFYDFRGAALYSPVTYAPYVPMAWFGQVFDRPLVTTLTMMRLVGIILCGFSFLAALKLAPFGKWVFFTVGLLPSTLAQSSAISADVIVLSLSVLFLVSILRLSVLNKPIKFIDFLPAFSFIALLGLTKVTYLPLILLFIILPIVNKQFRSRKWFLIIGATFLAASIVAFTWLQATSYIKVNYGTDINVDQQKDFVLSSPVEFSKTIYRTYFTNQNPNSVAAVWTGIFGNFGALSAPLPSIYIATAGITLVLSIFLRRENEYPPIRAVMRHVLVRAVMFASIATTLLAITLALYIYSSPFRLGYVTGIQGRYFVPILPLVGLLFVSKAKISDSARVEVAVYILCFVTIAGAILTALSRYY